ncbi:MAG: hypothetical protein M1839_002623 [Geoglossum umbratile]|nr:MAG: hypothetical protein M1839_002623 [Geoglossum umbratile]
MTPPTAGPEIHIHDPSGTTLLPHLLPLLPASLPLARRLQCQHHSAHTLVLASFPPTTTAAASPLSFTAAYCDRSRADETELWLFSTLEVRDSDAEAEAVLLALLRKVRTLTPHPAVLLVGALHERLFALLAARRLVLRDSGRCGKWVFRAGGEGPAAAVLPPGYRFGVVGAHNYGLVVRRSAVRRKEATLALLPSVAVVVADEAPVAWAFLGFDASLIALHVEDHHRRRGLAVALVRELAERVAEFGDDGWVHVDVQEGNAAGEAVCRSVGAREAWGVYWAWVDLEALA